MYKKGIAFGVFDIFHIGHLRYLEYAASHCQELYVGVRGDDLATPGKNRECYFSEDIRAELLSGLKCVSKSFVFHTLLDDTNYWSNYCKNNNIDVVFAGVEWKDSLRWNNLEESLLKHNIDVKYIDRTDGISSTMILNTETNPEVRLQSYPK